MESIAEEMHFTGLINESDRKAMATTQGHTLQTAKKFYVKQIRSVEYDTANKVVDRFMGINNKKSKNVSIPTGEVHINLGPILAADDVPVCIPAYKKIDWGTEHNSYHLGPNGRVEWSKKELLFIG